MTVNHTAMAFQIAGENVQDPQLAIKLLHTARRAKTWNEKVTADLNSDELGIINSALYEAQLLKVVSFPLPK